MQSVGIGVLGFGTVGTGVVQGLLQNGWLLSQRLGVQAELRAVADLDIETDRGVELPAERLTTDAHSLIASPDIQVIVELIGGTGIAFALVKDALKAGKPVVTANKKLLAEHGPELYALARETGTDLYFGASVGGGIPIIRAVREGLVGNRITRMQGILNGTCNYILTRMEAEDLPFETALAEAQMQGFAEADPSLDVDGLDTAHKAVILASLAYGVALDLGQVSVEGIRDLARTDVECAAELGYRIKLLAVIARSDASVEVRVSPALVPKDSMLASVSGVFNAVLVESDLADRTLYYGRGAGQRPTASTVLADIADAVRNLALGVRQRVPALPPTGENPGIKPMDEVRTSYYIRLAAEDRPGVLAQITGALGEQGISIASVLQDRADASGLSRVVITTHEAREADMNAALAAMDELPSVQGETVRLRIASRKEIQEEC